jgi:hypothetical protein
MRWTLFLATLALLPVSLGVRAQVAAQTTWVQFNSDGAAEVRVAVSGDVCPAIRKERECVFANARIDCSVP